MLQIYRSKKVSRKERNLREEAEKWFVAKLLSTYIRISIGIPILPALRGREGFPWVSGVAKLEMSRFSKKTSPNKKVESDHGSHLLSILGLHVWTRVQTHAHHIFKNRKSSWIYDQYRLCKDLFIFTLRVWVLPRGNFWISQNCGYRGFLNNHVGDWNWIQTIWKSMRCSKPLRYLI